MQSKNKSVLAYFNRNKDNMDNLIRTTAGLSFIIGTLILITFLCFHSSEIFIFGYGYVFIAILINLLMLLFTLVLIFYKYYQKENTSEHWTSLFTLLTNIPIALVYFFLVMTLAF